MATKNFEEVWDDLEHESREDLREGILTLRIFPESRFDLFLGVQKPDNIRMLLIRIGRENVINPWSFPRSKGFEIRQTVLSEDWGHHATIQIVLNDPHYRDIFSCLTEDVSSFCSREPSEKAMLQALFLRLEKWQQFLDRYGNEGLSLPAQRGLYGELRFLQDYLIPAVGAAQAVSAWTGPKKTPQDFQMADVAIEVKTSITKQHQKILIASEQQLDDTGLDALYLYHLSLRELHDGGETLPEIVAIIRDELSGYPVQSNIFEDLLFLGGYLDKHHDMYKENGYADRSAHIFHVREGFPRITEQDLSNGVGDVQYSVSLSACAPFAVDDGNFRAEIIRCKNE